MILDLVKKELAQKDIIKDLGYRSRQVMESAFSYENTTELRLFLLACLMSSCRGPTTSYRIINNTALPILVRFDAATDASFERTGNELLMTPNSIVPGSSGVSVPRSQ
jgi:hypothetical protein